MVRTFKLDENTINDKSQTGYEVTEKIADCLKIVDNYIEDAYEEINRHSDLRYVEYTSLASDITKIENYSRDYYNFRKFTNEYDDNVDSIFFKYQENAMKYLSSIRLQDIQIDNNLGITEKYTHPYRTDMPVQDIPKAKLNIDNLLSYEEVDDALRAQYKEQQEMIKKLKELAALKEEEWPEGITKEQKEQIKAYVDSLKESGEDQESYDDQIKRLLKEGEFEFETKNEQRITTVLNCIPVVGDIKGIAEVIAGKDLVTGRKLSDLEKGINLVVSIVGLTQVGKLAGVPAKIAAKESVKAGVKEILKDGAKYTLKETTKNLVIVEAFDELSKIGVDLGVGPKTQLAIMAGLLYGHGKLKSKLSGNTVGNILEDAKNIDEIKTIAKDAADMKNIDGEIKAAVKDAEISKVSKAVEQTIKNEKINKNVVEEASGTSKANTVETVAKDAADMKNIDNEAKAAIKDVVNSEANITKAAGDVGQAIKDENIAKDVMTDAKSIEKATTKIVDVLKSDMNKLFDHVIETVKEGTKIIFTMAENGKKVAIEIADLIKNKISDAAIEFCITGCFTGDTLVLSKEGYVKIEDINIGDYVYSQDVRTGEKGYKEVLQLQKRSTCEFVKVKVEGEGQEIQVTPSHLFYTNGQWELAGNLKPGDILTSANGEEKKVVSVENYLAKELEAIYNFSVDEYNTYFVSEFGILVHNMGCSKIETAMKEAAEVMPKFTFNDLKALQQNMKSSIKYTSTMFRELMQGVKTRKFGLDLVDDVMREEFKLDGRATHRFDVYKPKLDVDGKVMMEGENIVYDGSKITVFTDKTGKPVKVIHEVGEDGTIIDRKKVKGYTNADTKPYERGHIFSFQEGLADNCIEDSPLNIIPQSTPVNSPKISQFEAYRGKECKGMKVITDINIPDPPGYVRVRVPEAGIDVRYNPLATKESATAWKADWFMPKNAGKIYD